MCVQVCMHIYIYTYVSGVRCSASYISFCGFLFLDRGLSLKIELTNFARLTDLWDWEMLLNFHSARIADSHWVYCTYLISCCYPNSGPHACAWNNLFAKLFLQSFIFFVSFIYTIYFKYRCIVTRQVEYLVVGFKYHSSTSLGMVLCWI